MTDTKTTTEIPELAQQVRDQFVSTVKQGQSVTLDAVNAFSKAVASFPTPKLPEAPAVIDFKAVTTYSFDFVQELVNAQREFAIQLATALTPAKSA